MKKLSAILTFLCLMLLIGGHGLVFSIHLAELKSEGKAAVAEHSAERVVKLQFSNKEAAGLVWEEDDELRYEGTLYDVVKKETTPGKTIIYCIADGEETALIDNYLKFQRPSDHQPSQSLLKLLSGNFLLPAVAVQLPLPKLPAPPFAEVRSTLCWLCKNVPAPPPWS